MAKLVDIANELNISVSTVSKALNDSGRVSQKLREKIKQTAQRMHYYPNESARILKTKSSTMIGVIMPDITNIFYGKLLKEIDRAARQKGYTVIYHDSCESLENETDYFNMLNHKNICGMIIATCGLNSFYDELDENENIVFIDSIPSEKIRHPFIAIDNYQAAYFLTEYVLSQGYRDLMMISGHQIDTTTIARVRGFKDCMSAHGFNVAHRVVESDHSFSGGRSALDRILQNAKPDAIIADNNFMAYGAISSIRNHNLQVPGDIALACFDSIDDFDIMFVKLTSVMQPIELIAQRAVEIIVNKNEKRESSETENRIFLDYTLNKGDSV